MVEGRKAEAGLGGSGQARHPQAPGICSSPAPRRRVLVRDSLQSWLAFAGSMANSGGMTIEQ